MTEFRGLTWDHPRGYQALRTAAQHADVQITWDVQALEGFEAAPIGETAQRYDLIVLDHPHLGEALAQHALQPVDDLFGPDEVAALRRQSVGPSAESYVSGDMLWALPLDAATQVSVVNDTGVTLPQTWAEAIELATQVTAVVPTTGPHLFLTLCAIAVGDGAQPGSGDRFLTEDQVGSALETLRHFATGSPPGATHNPITVLEQMARRPEPMYSPHVYGYVNYSGPLTFGNAPRGASGRRGSVLGGTGIAFTTRSRPDAALLRHLRWLLESKVQRGFLVTHAGQPGATAAWEDPRVDTAAAGFYSGTRATVDDAWVRPRHNGAIAFQQSAADAVRECLFGHRDADRLAATINDLYSASTEAGAKEPV